MTRPRRTRQPSYKVLENAIPGYRSPTSNRHRDPVGRRSRKTTRVEVVVPTLRQVDARLDSRTHIRSVREHDPQERYPSLQIKSEEDVAKMYFLLPARIKAEATPEETISENVVRDRLALAGYDTFDLKVPPDILDVTTTRYVMTRIWGGCLRATFPKIGKRFTHGLDDFMYISLLQNPHAPHWPGSPGLIFKFRDDGLEWPKIMRLIVHLRGNVWQYMGQYKLTAALPLTPEEWNAQSCKGNNGHFQVKRRWATRLSRTKMDDGLKAKIALRRRLGRDPTPQEILKSSRRLRVSPDEILQACDEGRAVVRVWCMKCVGYDVDFQRRIAAGF